MVPYRFERSRKLRRIKLLVSGSDVILRAPNRESEKNALAFMRTQGDWLLDALARSPKKVTMGEHLQKYPWLTAFGRKLDILMECRGDTVGYALEREENRVRLFLNPWEMSDDVYVAVLHEFARKVIPERVFMLSRTTGVQPKRVSIRNQQSKWGSCSQTGTVTFNWRLTLLPPKLCDYLIFHELTHLIHLNHSADYWNALCQFDKNARMHDRKLSTDFSQIMYLGR